MPRHRPLVNGKQITAIQNITTLVTAGSFSFLRDCYEIHHGRRERARGTFGLTWRFAGNEDKLSSLEVKFMSGNMQGVGLVAVIESLSKHANGY